MSLYLIVKTLHIISSTVLFGTGLGIAFFMFRARFTADLNQRLYAARNTVLADTLFTFPAGMAQPLSGVWLAIHAGFRLTDLWLAAAIGLYLVAGACWLPVVWIQLELRNMLEQSEQSGLPLPPRYQRLFNWWFLLGWPAFAALLSIFYLMVAKPI